MKLFKYLIISQILIVIVLAGDNWDYSIPNVSYLHRTTNEPWDIHMLIIDLKNPGTSLKNVIGQDKAWGREVVSQMAERHEAIAAVNTDFCGYDRGIPEGLCIIDNEIIIAPKYRTAIGFTNSYSAQIGMWTDRWNWYAKVRDAEGNEHDVVMMNLDINLDWLCLFTDEYGHTTPGKSVSSNVVEVVVGSDSTVQEIRKNKTGIQISTGCYVLTGRESAADWLSTNISLGEKLTLELTTVPDWRNLWQAASGGPRIVKDGQYYADPIATFPNGEDFTLNFKNSYYNYRHPRCAAGITVNGDTLILAVVDGRQPSHSIGMTLHELADLMIEFGIVDALQFDSGGSATFYYKNFVRNSPSDGTERAVAGALCIFCDKNYLNIAPQANILDYSGEYSPDYSILKLIDGNKSRGSGKWVGEVSDSLHWVELDLGKIYTITHYQLFHGFYCGDPDYLNTKEFTIFSRSDTSKQWQEDFHVINEKYQARDNLCTFETLKNIRYVRFEVSQANHVTDDNILRQPEFEIYIEDTTATTINSNSYFVPKSFKLFQNYPNPFNPRTTIIFSIPYQTDVKLKIYNLLGMEVLTLLDRQTSPGNHSIEFNSHILPSGIYYYRLETNYYSTTRKMTLMK